MHLCSEPTSTEWIYFVSILIGLGSFVVAAEMIRKALRWSPEVTRKLVHIATGILIYFAPQLFNSGIPAILLAVVFIIINYSAIRFGLLKGMHGTNRRSYGTVYYPLSFLLLVLIFWETLPQIISIAILVLALSDAAAAIVGENLRAPRTYYLTSDKKSLEGSAAMFLVTVVVIAVSLFSSGQGAGMIPGVGAVLSVLIVAAVVSLFATVWEAISSKGLDNLAIPMSVAFVLHFFFTPSPLHNPVQFSEGIFFAGVVALLSFTFRFLSASGSAATFLLATVIFGLGGWTWGIPVLVFFVLSSLLSKLGKEKKAQFHLLFEKSDKRDAGQVAANGGMAGMVALGWYVAPAWPYWYAVYLSSLAAVTADTWGTEIGVLARGKPRSIRTLRPVDTGTSGGVSLAGILGGALGALAVAVSGLPWQGGIGGFGEVGAIVLAGVFASLVDSFLGATLQAQFRCVKCGKITERRLHCGEPTAHVSGFLWLDNDVVNWCCAAAGCIFYLAALGV
ncbi:MAG TPA: DUF92 domain-containing protein [Bacteroidota bacterium]|nr:DUF92 domain-containing protein [Bacteroidota bacterium]